MRRGKHRSSHPVYIVRIPEKTRGKVSGETNLTVVAEPLLEVGCVSMRCTIGVLSPVAADNPVKTKYVIQSEHAD